MLKVNLLFIVKILVSTTSKVAPSMFSADHSLQQRPANLMMFVEPLAQPSNGSTVQGTPGLQAIHSLSTCNSIECISPCLMFGPSIKARSTVMWGPELALRYHRLPRTPIHQWITKETLSQYWNDECEFMSIYSSAFQPQVGGVVLLICKIFANSYMAAEKVSQQILKVYFKGNPLIVVYVIYAPSNVANDSDKAAFFNDLHKVSKEQPHSIVIMHDPDPRTTSRLRSSNFSLL